MTNYLNPADVTTNIRKRLQNQDELKKAKDSVVAHTFKLAFKNGFGEATVEGVKRWLYNEVTKYWNSEGGGSQEEWESYHEVIEKELLPELEKKLTTY